MLLFTSKYFIFNPWINYWSSEHSFKSWYLSWLYCYQRMWLEWYRVFVICWVFLWDRGLINFYKCFSLEKNVYLFLRPQFYISITSGKFIVPFKSNINIFGLFSFVYLTFYFPRKACKKILLLSLIYLFFHDFLSVCFIYIWG